MRCGLVQYVLLVLQIAGGRLTMHVRCHMPLRWLARGGELQRLGRGSADSTSETQASKQNKTSLLEKKYNIITVLFILHRVLTLYTICLSKKAAAGLIDHRFIKSCSSKNNSLSALDVFWGSYV